MIHTELIKNRFDSLEAYEKFALEWAEPYKPKKLQTEEKPVQ